jgi:hypothetical protein
VWRALRDATCALDCSRHDPNTLTADPTLDRLEKFNELLEQWRKFGGTHLGKEFRSAINREKNWVRQQVIEAGCFGTLTISPPPAVGGLLAQNVDPFWMMFEPPYGVDLMQVVHDMVDQTIGVIRAGPVKEPRRSDNPVVQSEVEKGYAFVAMPILSGDPENDDVLDAVKEAARRCGITAERVDEPASSERITDRILQSIRRAEFVIVDLTHSRQNVYYEAGYAHGFGKLPIYIAREGTKLEFDLKDYPVIFFRGMKQLKDDLERRLRGLGTSAKQ